jgi:hypothetical protein
LKAGCVFDITQRQEFDAHTQEEVELGSASNNSYVAHLVVLSLSKCNIT